MAGIIKDMGKKVGKGVVKAGQTIVEGGHKGFQVLTESQRSGLEKDIPEKRPDAYEKCDLQVTTYEIENVVEQLHSRAAQQQTEEDTIIEKAENVAFRHHYYHAQKNYEPAYPLVLDKEEHTVRVKRNSYMQNIRGFMLRRFVITNDEIQTEKMNNIFSSMASLGSTLALVIHRTPDDCTFSFLTSTTKSDLKESGSGVEDRANQIVQTLENVLCGNFPGTEIRSVPSNGQPQTFAEMGELYKNAVVNLTDVRGWMSIFRRKAVDQKFDYEVKELMDEVFYRNNRKAVAAVTGIPAMKSEESKFVSQGIEKLIDGIVPQNEDESYTLMLLATPLSPQEVALQRNGYEQIASQLSPLQSFQFSVTETQGNSGSSTTTKTLSRQMSEATTLSAGVGAHAGASANASASAGGSFGRNKAMSTGESTTHGKTSDTTVGGSLSRTGTTSAGISVGAANVGASTSTTGTISASKGWGKSETKGTSSTESHGISATQSFSQSATAGASAGISGHLDMTENLTVGRSYCWSSSIAQSLECSLSQGETRSYTSEPVKRVVERLQKEIQRLEMSESCGMWRFAGYAIAGNFAMAQRVASVYQGIIQGENSQVERSSINIWTDRDKNFNAIIISLLNLEHPLFRCQKKESNLPESMFCATELTSGELALAMSLPQKAVPGLPVVTCAPFGRTVQTVDGRQEANPDSFRLGQIYHMMQADQQIPVMLDKTSLTAHTFVTGSTGAGKSNTIYKLLMEAWRDNIPFLVIEPAKGEYKDAFGNIEGVQVFGTNYQFSPLLRLNPFSFPGTVHVLEHIDRIIEIFNACWPMYAAMPAILKDTFVRAYVEAGWDVQLSKCSKEPFRYPTFQSILNLLPEVIKESAYSADTTSDYVGALVTRVRSLTTGLNSLVFTDDELDFSQLFEQATIIDLSRVASTETKSLIMGMLVIKLQEFRMHEAEMNRTNKVAYAGTNRGLRHITVLEEAHNLLRLTSPVQSQETANLQGKSVELIANSIAEMRTYGEGFIIADQAPGLLDPVVIRNTNTKIILRLPDQEDRDLVGRAAALTEQQRDELAKLPRGVAAVYQSDWLEAVLCLVDYADVGEGLPYTYEGEPELPLSPQEIIAKLVVDEKTPELTDGQWIRIAEWSQKNVGVLVQDLIAKLQKKEDISEQEKKQILYDTFYGKDLGGKIREIITGQNGDRALFQKLYGLMPLHESPERDLLAKKICNMVFDQYCFYLGKEVQREAENDGIVDRLRQTYFQLEGVK